MDVRRELLELSIYVRQKFVDAIDNATDDELKKDGTLGYLIKYACDHCGFDGNRVGEVLEISHTTISRWKSGKTEPHQQYRVDVICKLREAVESDIRKLKRR